MAHVLSGIRPQAMGLQCSSVSSTYGQRHFRVLTREYEPEAQASEQLTAMFTRLRFGLVLAVKVAPSSELGNA